MYQIALYNMNSKDHMTLTTLLERYATYTDTKIGIKNFDSGFDLLGTKCVYHIAIVDISKLSETALKVGRRFLENNPHARLILLSNSQDQYQEGFRVGAHRFFVTPLVDDQFFNEMTEIFEQLSNRLSSIRINETIDELVSIDSIIYAESDNRKVRFYTDRGVIESKETFSYWYDVFENTDILLCFRGCLVNLKHIHSIDKTTINLHNGKNIPVSRRLRSSIVRKHDNYLKKNK